MTCIVAIKEGNTIYMGADSAGTSSSFEKRIRTDPKIYHVDGYMFGFTTSFRMGQLLGYAFVPPDRDPRIPLEKFMATAFIDAVRKCLKDGGFAQKQNEEEQGGQFLVAYEGRLFQVWPDYQVAESVEGYESCGCGSDLAMGSLYTTGEHTIMYPKERMKVALEVAEKFSAGVQGPFIYGTQTIETKGA